MLRIGIGTGIGTGLRIAVASLLLLAGLVGAGLGVAAQTATPAAGGDPVGAWLVRETLPPPGVEPPLAFVLSFFADGNAVATAFSDGGTMQGVWVRDNDGAVTFTLVGPGRGGTGIAPDTVVRYRATIEVAGDGFAGGYTVETLDGDLENPGFTYSGPLGGERIEVQGPDPVALQVADRVRAGATPGP